MTDATSGLGLALMALFAGGGAPLWGKKANSYDNRKICAFGLILETLAIFLIGPAEPLPGTLGLMIPGMILLGIGTAAV